jgi:hypothetical protein
VAIGQSALQEILPFLFWQDVQGQWSLFQYNSATGGNFGPLNYGFNATGTFPLDLATGIGWNNGGASLQVGYLAADGNIYIDYQDQNGNWFWHAGLSGNGLP